MSQTKVWPANKGTTTRVATDGSPKQGAGDCKRLYVGRYGSNDYRSYLNFAFDWPTTGTIVSAILSLSTDDALGILGDTQATTDTPKVYIRRLTSTFSEHTGSEVFATADYTIPTNTSSGAVSHSVSKGVLDVTNIDITAIVEAWAPRGVKKRSGASGGAGATDGILLYGDTDAHHNAAFVSEDAEPALASFEPYITLTYELGHTTPDAPSNMTPTGAVADIGSFQGDFVDQRPTDKLRYSQVNVFHGTKTGSADAVDDSVGVTAHGFLVGDPVWFLALTGGAGLALTVPYYVRTIINANSFKVSATKGGTVVNITSDYSALTVGRPLYDVRLPESATAITNARFDHVPDNLNILPNTNYTWRARVTDNEGQTSAWTGLVTFSVTNTKPNAPTLSPGDGSSFASLDGILFRGGTFTDPDAGDYLLAYEVQMSAYAEGDAHWLDDEFILWSTGKRYVGSGATDWQTPYGGDPLDAGTYHWRARQYDNHHGVSDWAYASVVVTADFIPDPEDSTNSIQMRPRAPWRIVIRAMGANRGPGAVVAILEDAMNVGASIMYNSPGEAHWTLGAHHPQISVIEPRQTHYAIEFRQGGGWREVFAGLVWDFDATNSDIVFYGVDYLGLLDFLVDENYDSSNGEKDYASGGSKYSSKAIGLIIRSQLARAIGLSNSPVGFITIPQSEATLIALMGETQTVYSTYAPTLNFVTSLIDSHRAGTGKRSRISVRKSTAGAYQFFIADDPGTARDNLRLRYGELVQGYRVVPFGKQWGTRVAAIGRDKNGVKVRYNTQVAPGIDESTWGRWMIPQLMDGVSDDNDLARRARQFITARSMLGNQVGLGLRSGVLQPRDGYELLDKFPIDIKYANIDTTQFGHDGYWVAVGITWQSKVQGQQNTTLTFQPQESGSAPSSDLLVSSPISPQAEWQSGWVAPDPLSHPQPMLSLDTGHTLDEIVSLDTFATASTGRYYLDISTGILYELNADGSAWVTVSGPASPTAPTGIFVQGRTTMGQDGKPSVSLRVTVDV